VYPKTNGLRRGDRLEAKGVTMNKLLVVGRSGQLATALADFDWRVARVEAMGRPLLDLGSPLKLRSTLERHAPAAVINAAAYTAVDRAETEPELAYAFNRDGPLALAEAFDALGVPLIHVSTDYVFDGAKGAPYVEADPKRPLGVYGSSKEAGEDAVLQAHRDVCILRTSWVFSATGANFLKTMLRLAAEGRSEIVVVADQWGRPTYAPDLARACALVVTQWLEGRTPPHILHYANSGDAVWADLAQTVFEKAGERGLPVAIVRRITTADDLTPACRPADARLDTSPFEKTYGDTRRVWREPIDDCLAHFIRLL
jgi:dTDP-4-dehydrorhamnose reductase